MTELQVLEYFNYIGRDWSCVGDSTTTKNNELCGTDGSEVLF